MQHPDVLRRVQFLMDVDNQSVTGAFHRGWANNHETHAQLVQLLTLQVEYGYMLSLRWIPIAKNTIAVSISRQ